MRRSIVLTVLVATLVPAWGSIAKGDGGKAWALVVGVGAYPEVKERDLGCPNAVEDARVVANWLTTNAGWPADQVRLMTTSGSTRPELRPTLANLQAAVSEWLKGNVRRGDLIFIYFAGQALSKPESNQSDQLGGPVDFLLPVDFQFGKGNQSGWALDRDLAQFFGGEVQVFCCLDTSTAGRGTETVAKATPANRLLKALAPWPGWAAWIAADNGQASADKDRARPGSPLRHRLLKALGTDQQRNNMLACLDILKGDEDLARSKFRTRGVLRPSLTLWSGKVENVVDQGIRPVLQRGHAAPITGLIARADGGGFFSSSEDSTVRIWRPGDEPGASAILDRVLSEPIGEVSCLAISPDGKWIAAGSGLRDDVWLWGEDGTNVSLELKFDRKRSKSPIRSISFLPDSRRFVTVNKAGQVHVWNVATKRPAYQFDGVDVDRNCSIAFASSSAGLSPVAVACLAYNFTGDVALKLLGADGELRNSFVALTPATTALDLSRDGLSLAIGNDEGRCEILDVSNPAVQKPPIFQRQLSGEKIEHLRLLGDGWLAIGTDRNLRLFDRSKGGPSPVVALSEPVDGVDKILFSDDGRLLAAVVRDASGLRARLWRLGDDRKVTEVVLGEGLADAPRVLAFSGQGRELLVGGQGGSIWSWALDEGRTKVVATPPPIRLDPSQIKSISPAPDGRRFVRVCQDGKAFLFDFDRRVSIPLKHEWNSLGFLPDGRLLGTLSGENSAITQPMRSLYLGRPVVYDLDKDQIEPGIFSSPVDIDPANVRLDRMAVSGDGKFITVDRRRGSDQPETILWDSLGGAPLRRRGPANGLDRITAFALAPSGGEVVICTPEGATLHDGPQPGFQLPRLGLDDEFSAAAFAPAKGARMIALGSRKNGVVLWSPGLKGPESVRFLGGKFDVAVETLSFTSSDDRLWLVASGVDKRFTAWELKPSGHEVVAMEPSGPAHDAVIRDVRTWPKLAMIATAGDDSTVRFWSLKHGRLIGTLAFSRVGQDDLTGLNWVAYSPDGRFDCPPEGKSLLKLVRQGKPIQVEQASGSLLDQTLIDRICTAQVGPTDSKSETPPNIALKAISPIGDDGTSPDRAIWLELLLDSPNPKDLRLYRNNMPTRGVDEFEKTDDPHRFRSFVTLRPGINTFRAVAAQGQAIEGISDALSITYHGNEDVSRVHVLAIGIDKYPKASQKLDFAVRDARDLSGRLNELDIATNGRPAEATTLLRVDDEVDEEEVKKAFRRLKDRVKNRPGDKVVVFLAGHTEQFGEDFGLLLSKSRAGEMSILKYSTILQGLAQLDAEQRLVIVDACQTDRIQSGEEARNFARRELRALERHSLKFPTQYILASKAGEPALEDRELGHGLLTYALLSGLGRPQVPPKLKNDSKAVASFSKQADEDDDGKITTDELNRYATSRLPILLAAYQDSARTARGKVEDERNQRAQREADQLRVGSDSGHTSFDLVKLSKAAP